MNPLEEETEELTILHNCDGCPKLTVDKAVINNNDEIEVINEDVDFESLDAEKCTQLVQNSNGQSIRIDVSSRQKINLIY